MFSIHIHAEGWTMTYVIFRSVGFGVNSDISVGEDGFLSCYRGECVIRQRYSFLYFCVASGI